VTADGTYSHLHAKWFAALELPSNRRLIIGGDHNFPPYEYLDERGRPTGFNTELTLAAAQEAGLQVEIRLEPWSGIRQQLERGEIDAAQGMLYSPERDLNYDFTTPHTLIHYVAVGRQGEAAPPSDVEQLRDRSLVVQSGDLMHDFALKNAIGRPLSLADTQEDALRELAQGRHDYALVARRTALSGMTTSEMTGAWRRPWS
jgi:ABC-type amino acid transport substrate-binding protein